MSNNNEMIDRHLQDIQLSKCPEILETRMICMSKSSCFLICPGNYVNARYLGRSETASVLEK